MRTIGFLQRHRDAGYGLLVAAVYVVEVVARAGRPWTLLALAPVVVLVVAARRRAPLLSIALVVALWQVTEAVDPPFNEEGGLAWLITWLVAHYALGRWTRGVTAVCAPIVSAAAAVALGWDDIADSGAADLAYFLSVSLLPWGVGAVVRLRQERVAVLTAENQRLEREQAVAAQRAVAEERSRIARELHDVVAHAIAVTVLQARGARRQLGKDEASVREALDAIEGTNTAALGDMRRLLAALRDTEADTEGPDREPQPSLARLDRLLDEVRAAGLDVELVTEGEPAAVPPGVDLSAYRIVQEALTNVLKHAGTQATAVVRLAHRPTELTISVSDHGGAGGPGGGSGHGLLGIRERVAVVGGEVAAGPRADGGFEVAARLPYALELS